MLVPEGRGTASERGQLAGRATCLSDSRSTFDGLVAFKDGQDARGSRDAAETDSAQSEIMMARWIWERAYRPSFPLAQPVVSASGGSFVAGETIERLHQRIHDRLAERLCCLSDLGFVSLAGRGGEFRTLIRQDRIGPIDCPLRKILRLSMILVSIGARSCWPIRARVRSAMGIAFAPKHSSRLAASRSGQAVSPRAAREIVRYGPIFRH